MARRNPNHVSLIYNVTGQTVEFYPPDAELIQDGAPTTAANYRVFGGTDSQDATPQIALSAATLDSVSTTVGTASGYSQSNRKRVHVASTTNFAVGRRYLLTSPTSQREIFTCGAIGTTSYVDAEYDLSYDYAASGSSTVKGIRHVFTIDATFIQTESKINFYGAWVREPGLADQLLSTDDNVAPPYRTEWQYSTAGGVARRHWTTFDVCRAPAQHNVTIDDLRALWPDSLWFEWVSQNGQRFAPQVEKAFERVKFDIRAARYDPDSVRDPEVMDQLTQRMLLVTLAEAGERPPGYDSLREFLEVATRNYEAMKEKSIGAGLFAWLDTGGDGAITPDPIKQLTLNR